jgi:hypothetical protein
VRSSAARVQRRNLPASVSIGLGPEIVARRNRETFSGRMSTFAATVKSFIIARR